MVDRNQQKDENSVEKQKPVLEIISVLKHIHQLPNQTMSVIIADNAFIENNTIKDMLHVVKIHRMKLTKILMMDQKVVQNR